MHLSFRRRFSKHLLEVVRETWGKKDFYLATNQLILQDVLKSSSLSLSRGTGSGKRSFSPYPVRSPNEIH